MDDKFRDILDGEEKAAIEILEEHGWVFLSEIEVEKATPTGEKWPSYVLGGTYPMGVVVRPGSVNEPKLPPKPKKDRKGKKS